MRWCALSLLSWLTHRSSIEILNSAPSRPETDSMAIDLLNERNSYVAALLQAFDKG
jgi:hypothetical protein